MVAGLAAFCLASSVRSQTPDLKTLCDAERKKEEQHRASDVERRKLMELTRSLQEANLRLRDTAAAGSSGKAAQARFLNSARVRAAMGEIAAKADWSAFDSQTAGYLKAWAAAVAEQDLVKRSAAVAGVVAQVRLESERPTQGGHDEGRWEQQDTPLTDERVKAIAEAQAKSESAREVDNLSRQMAERLRQVGERAPLNFPQGTDFLELARRFRRQTQQAQADPSRAERAKMDLEAAGLDEKELHDRIVEAEQKLRAVEVAMGRSGLNDDGRNAGRLSAEFGRAIAAKGVDLFKRQCTLKDGSIASGAVTGRQTPNNDMQAAYDAEYVIVHQGLAYEVRLGCACGQGRLGLQGISGDEPPFYAIAIAGTRAFVFGTNEFGGETIVISTPSATLTVRPKTPGQNPEPHGGPSVTSATPAVIAEIVAGLFDLSAL